MEFFIPFSVSIRWKIKTQQVIIIIIIIIKVIIMIIIIIIEKKITSSKHIVAVNQKNSETCKLSRNCNSSQNIQFCNLHKSIKSQIFHNLKLQELRSSGIIGLVFAALTAKNEFIVYYVIRPHFF